MRKLGYVVAVGTLVALAGCSEDKKPVVSCEILSPASGVLVSASDDVVPGVPGIQIDVTVRTANAPAGSQIELLVEGAAAVGPQPLTSADHTFSRVSLPPGPTSTRLVCLIPGTGARGEVAVRVDRGCGLRFVSPLPGESITRASARPGPDGRPVIDVVVEGAGLETGTPVTLEVGEPGQLQTIRQGTLSPTRAAFEVPVFQGRNTRLFARAVGGACSPTAEIRINVDLGQCITTLAPSSGTALGIADDLSPAPGGQPDLQTRVCLTTECVDGSNAFLKVDDRAEVRATVQDGIACFDVTLPPGTHSVEGRVQGAEQNGVAPVVTYCVDLDAPTVNVTAPANGVTLGQADDRDPLTPDVLDTVVMGSTTGTTTAGCAIDEPLDRVEVRVNDAVQSTFAPTQTGAFERPVRLPQGQNTVQVCAFDAVGNVACSARLEVTVDLQIPTLHIESPVAGARLLKAMDLDPTTDVRELDVVVRTTGLPPDESTVTLEVDHGRWVCSGQVQQGALGTIAQIRVGVPGCDGLPDGAHTLVAKAIDRAGNAARSQEVPITIDNHPPALSFTDPRDGAQVSSPTIGVVIATDAEDGQPVTLEVGAAQPLTVSARGGGAVFLGVPLQPGANTLVARVSDAAGNPATASINVVRDSTQPEPVFVNLADGRTLTAAEDKNQNLDDGLQFDVQVSVPNESDGTTRVSLQVGGRAAASQPLAGGVATFRDVGLAEGENVLRAVVRDGAGNTGTVSITVRVDTDQPEVRIGIPADGTAFSGADDLDPASEDFQLAVTVTTNVQTEIGSCILVADPGGADERRTPLALVGTTCAGRITLKEGPHRLVAEVEAGGQVVRSLPNRVTIDTRAPRLSFLRPIPPSRPLDPVVFNAASPDVDGRPGFQTVVEVQADDIEEGQGATLSVIPEGGGPGVTHAAIFDRQGRAVFPSVTLPDQRRSTLTVVATDRAGNSSTAAALSVVVDRSAPGVRITAPAAGQLFGLAGDESPAAGYQKTVVVEVTGVEPGEPVTLEIAPPNGAQATSRLALPVPADGGPVTFRQADLQIPSSGYVVLRASVADRQGNAASDAIAISVDTETGQIAWFSPPATPSPTLLCQADDEDPQRDGFQETVSFRVSGFVNGAPVVVKDAQGNEVGRSRVSGGNAFVTVTLGEGDRVLSASATRISGNVATTPDFRVLRVDTVGPEVSSILCDGDANGDGYLNRSEDGNSLTSGLFEMQCTVTFSDDSASGREVRILSTAPQPGTIVGSAVASGQSVTIPVALAAGSSPIGHELSASVTDACGNASTGAARYRATVDLVAPGVRITSPASRTLLAADDQNRTTETVLDLDVRAQVLDGATQATLKVNGTVAGTAPVDTGGAVLFPAVPLPQGSLTLTVEATDVAGNVGTSAPVMVLVDSIAPKIEITSPTTGQEVATNTVDVTVSYRDVEGGRAIRLLQGTGVLGTALTGGGDPSSTRTTTLRVPLQQGSHTIVAEVSDVNGNVGRSVEVSFTVTTSNPVVVFEVPSSNPAFFNRQSGTIDAQNRLHVDLAIQTTAPAGSTAFLLRNGAQVALAPVLLVGGVNRATFADQVLGATETGTLQARVRVDAGGTDTPCPGDNNNFCSAVVSYTVDLDPPSLSFQNPPCDAFLNAQDDQPGSDGTFVFTLATNAEDGQTVTVGSSATGGTVQGSVLGGSATTGGLSLPQGVQTLTARVSDRAGNETTTTCDTIVDVLPPVIPALTATRSPAIRSRVTLTWSMPGDDGLSGRVASYEIRSRNCAPGQTCGIATDDDFNNRATPVANLPPIADGGTAMTFDLDDLALEQTYHFAIRAADDAGNLSAITTATVSTAFASETVAGPAGESFYGYSIGAARVARDGQGNDVAGVIIGRLGAGASFHGGIRVLYADGRAATDFTGPDAGGFMGLAVANAGDVDGDGFEDVLVGAPGAPGGGKAYLFFGSANGVLVNAGGSPLVLSPPAGVNVGSYGQSLAGLGNVTGAAGARPHFAVGAGDFLVQRPSRVGRVFVYNVTGTRPNLTVNLVATLVGEANSDHFGSAVCGVGDVNGDGVPDIVVGASRQFADPAVKGVAYVFLGGSRLTGTVNVPSPDRPDDGVVPLRMTAGLAPDWFGYSCARSGNLDGSGPNDFLISAPGVGAIGVYAFRGRADLDASPPTSPDAILRAPCVTQDPPCSSFPSEVSSGFDINGDGFTDVVVGDKNAVYVFRGDPTLLVRSQPTTTFALTNDDQKPYAVTIVPNWKDNLPGEMGLPDIAIGNRLGTNVIIRY